MTVDPAAVMIVAGSAVQAAPAAQRIFACLRPRAAEFITTLRARPLPEPDADLDELIASID